MKTVTVTEANQEFSRIIKDLEECGESYVILRRGRPVARLVPHGENKMENAEWRAAYDGMMAHLKQGAHLGGLKINRDDLYDR